MTEDELKSILNIGKMQSDIEHIKDTCVRIESSMTRGGERMGKLEEGQSNCDKTTAVLSSSIKTLEKDVDKLEKSKSWFIMAIVGAFLTQLTQWIMGRKV